VIVAGTGGDMARFATSSRLAAWAGLAPGDNESAGKRKKAAARKGNPTSEPRWSGGVGRLPHREPPGSTVPPAGPPVRPAQHQKAAVTVARTLLCVAWAVMKDDSDYAEAGAGYYDQRDQRNHEHLARHHQQAPLRLGYQVTLIPPGDANPPGPDSDTPQHPAA